MNNSAEYSITVNTNALIRGIQTKYPRLPRKDIQILANTILDEIGRRLNSGDDLAFIRPNRDGSFDVGSCGISVQQAFPITHAAYDSHGDSFCICERFEHRDIIGQIAFMDATEGT